MTVWSAWLPDLLPKLPECPVPLVEHELKRAAQDFFRDTKSWQITLPTVPVLANAEFTTITAPEGSALESIIVAWYDGQKILPTTADELSKDFGDDWELHTGTPCRYIEETPGYLRLYPRPLADASSGFKAKVAVTPASAAGGIPDNLAETYQDILSDGALSRLMIYPNKPWTNYELGGAALSRFGGAMAVLKTKLTIGSGQKRSRPSWC